MSMDIKKAIETGDKVGVFGNSGGPNLRGTIRTCITEANDKNKTVNLEDAMAYLKKAGFTMEAEVNGKTVSIQGKVKTALEDLKYAGFCHRAVTDDDTREYYLNTDAKAEVSPEAPADESDEESDEDVE